jgi:hypothetical protein
MSIFLRCLEDRSCEYFERFMFIFQTRKRIPVDFEIFVGIIMTSKKHNNLLWICFQSYLSSHSLAICYKVECESSSGIVACQYKYQYRPMQFVQFCLFLAELTTSVRRALPVRYSEVCLPEIHFRDLNILCQFFSTIVHRTSTCDWFILKKRMMHEINSPRRQHFFLKKSGSNQKKHGVKMCIVIESAFFTSECRDENFFRSLKNQP